MRVWNVAFVSLALVVGIACADPAGAESAHKRLSAQRFMIPGQEDLTGAQDVVVKPVTSSDLPDEFREMMQGVLDQCVKDVASVDELTYYSYESRRTRAARALPNVIVDFRPLAGKIFKRCAQPSALLCEGQSCQLAGYAYYPANVAWKQVFSVMPMRWSVENMKVDANNSAKGEAYFSVLTKMPVCEEQGGSLVDGDCLQRLVWRGESLTPLATSQKTDSDR